MKQLKTKPFPYYVGIRSLEELVNKQSRVCVLNILGSESRKVTPVSHEYSGGNVVAGVQYGRAGGLETRIGEIPVFRSVRDVIKSGRRFDTGVIYLPPLAVSQAVWELVSYNPDLRRIVIVTEKVTVKDSRNIRFTCQEVGVDVIGANCLGVANAWDHVRVGGALGGDHPEEALKKGSAAIHSNSGNFTTTIAEYLKTAGVGVSTAVSSGKDVYIHYALPEFLYAAQNDPRTKAVALYVEPGGYYEKQALEWIREKRFPFTKPMVVCVTGRWKKEIARPCGHAGAMSGSGDDAESKERWFDAYFEAGATYKVLLGPKHELSVDGGLTRTHEERIDNVTRNFWGGLAGVSYAWHFSANATLTERAVLFPNFNYSSDWRVTSDTAVQAKLTDLLALKVAYQVKYSNQPPADKRKTDTATLASVVVSF